MIRWFLFLACCLLAPASALAEPRHGIAMHGEPALPPDFTHLPYANPDAPQGGTLHQALVGSFDSLNPFIVRGQVNTNAIRTYVFESLLGRNWDEPFSLYGLLAETIDISDDRNVITFHLRPEARFSDGTPVTAADVVFSLETLRDKGRPNYKNAYRKITKIDTPDARTIVFTQTESDRELPLIIGLMPIIPKHEWEKRDFEKTTLNPIIGSGPYVLDEIRPGESMTFRKNKDYWGKDLAINKGVWNFDEIRIDYFRDNNSAFEAFKKGLIDIRVEADPGRWSTAYDFAAIAKGDVIRETIEQRSPAATTGFAFNTRRPIFSDIRVRRALLEAFDFEWANANLLSNLYHRTYGYYSGSELSSMGRPADQHELALLADDAKAILPSVLDGTYELPKTDGSGRDRKTLRRAVNLFKEAGWIIKDGQLVNAETGVPFTFTLSIISKDQEKIALHFQRTLRQIGIEAAVRLVDTSQFQRMLLSYDYDMVPVAWYNSLSPGNEQKFYYGSEGRTVEGTRNYPGIADPAVDRMIDALLKANSRADFVAAVRALDRLLVSACYIIPFYDAGGQWVARWKRIGRPEHQPLPGFEGTTLWYEAAP
jgi:peptide/nickel transport system substrate-binding protein